MTSKARAWLLVGLVGLVAASCTRLDRTRPVPAFQLEPRQGDSAIPLSYGDLVAVTPVEGRAYQVVMWFEQGQDRIIGVRFNVGSGIAADQVLVIPRR
jgi:hypothetical protein